MAHCHRATYSTLNPHHLDKGCEMEEILSRLAECEARYRQLRVFLFRGALALVLLLVLGILSLGWLLRRPMPVADSLQLKDLVIVDDQGVARVRLGGRLPDPIMNGKSVPRGQQVAGLLLYDDTGQERGGYLTFFSLTQRRPDAGHARAASGALRCRSGRGSSRTPVAWQRLR